MYDGGGSAVFRDRDIFVDAELRRWSQRSLTNCGETENFTSCMERAAFSASVVFVTSLTVGGAEV